MSRRNRPGARRSDSDTPVFGGDEVGFENADCTDTDGCAESGALPGMGPQVTSAPEQPSAAHHNYRTRFNKRLGVTEIDPASIPVKPPPEPTLGESPNEITLTLRMSRDGNALQLEVAANGSQEYLSEIYPRAAHHGHGFKLAVKRLDELRMRAREGKL